MNLYKVELTYTIHQPTHMVVYLLAENDALATMQVSSIYNYGMQIDRLERLTGNSDGVVYLRGSWEFPAQKNKEDLK